MPPSKKRRPTKLSQYKGASYGNPFGFPMDESTVKYLRTHRELQPTAEKMQSGRYRPELKLPGAPELTNVQKRARKLFLREDSAIKAAKLFLRYVREHYLLVPERPEPEQLPLPGVLTHIQNQPWYKKW